MKVPYNIKTFYPIKEKVKKHKKEEECFDELTCVEGEGLGRTKPSSLEITLEAVLKSNTRVKEKINTLLFFFIISFLPLLLPKM